MLIHYVLIQYDPVCALSLFYINSPVGGVVLTATFLSQMVWACPLQVANAGALVFRVGWVLLSVSEHFGEGYLHVLIHCLQLEIPESAGRYG